MPPKKHENTSHLPSAFKLNQPTEFHSLKDDKSFWFEFNQDFIQP